MTLATWIAIAIAGPGALGVFVWFLRDLLRPRPPHAERKPDTTAKTSSGRSGTP